MTDLYYDVLSVISQKGTCALEHKVSEEWIIGGSKTPGGLCLSVFNTMLPNIWLLMFGGVLPWENDPDTATVACPYAASGSL
ncbi:hypothetical protein ACFLT8_06485 [Chloroflexota bacterium]